MAQIYFSASNARGAMNLCRADVDDLSDVAEHAARVVRLLIAIPTTEDWRNWILHASDELGEEIFAMPFASVIGRAH